MLREGNSAGSEGPLAQWGFQYSVKGQRNWVDELLYLYAGWERKSIKTHLVFSLHDTVSQVYVCTCDWAYMHLCKNTWGSKQIYMLARPHISRIQSLKPSSHPALTGFESWREYKWSFNSLQDSHVPIIKACQHPYSQFKIALNWLLFSNVLSF